MNFRRKEFVAVGKEKTPILEDIFEIWVRAESTCSYAEVSMMD